MVYVDDIDASDFDNMVQRRVYDLDKDIEKKRLCDMLSRINSMVLNADRVERLGNGFNTVYTGNGVFHFRMGNYGSGLLFVDRVVESLDSLDELF